jgi:hypothetical protein
MEIFNKIVLTLDMLWMFFLFLGALASAIFFKGDVRLWLEETKEDKYGRIYYSILFYLTFFIFFSILYWPLYFIWNCL